MPASIVTDYLIADVLEEDWQVLAGRQQKTCRWRINQSPGKSILVAGSSAIFNGTSMWLCVSIAIVLAAMAAVLKSLLKPAREQNGFIKTAALHP